MALKSNVFPWEAKISTWFPVLLKRISESSEESKMAEEVGKYEHTEEGALVLSD